MGLLVLLSLAFAVVAANFDRGFNSNIAWTNELDAGLARAKAEGKPALVLIHKTWCGACKRLKTVWADSKALEETAKDFVMVNLEDNEEPLHDAYRPDGGYIPRILFVHSGSGAVMDVYNEGGNASYKVYYSDEPSILKAMKTALAKNIK